MPSCIHYHGYQLSFAKNYSPKLLHQKALLNIDINLILPKFSTKKFRRHPAMCQSQPRVLHQKTLRLKECCRVLKTVCILYPSFRISSKQKRRQVNLFRASTTCSTPPSSSTCTPRNVSFAFKPGEVQNLVAF